jgi:hypothetical protein
MMFYATSFFHRNAREESFIFFALSLAPPATVRAASTSVRDGSAGVAFLAVRFSGCGSQAE